MEDQLIQERRDIYMQLEATNSQEIQKKWLKKDIG